MIKKKILFLLLLSLLILPLSSAYFTKTHHYFDLKAFQQVNSPLTQLCSDKLVQVLDGETAADVPVLHYYDEEFLSYISTHTRGSGYNECRAEAGNDPDLQCVCVGIGLHNVEDHFAHTEEGIVPKYLESSASPNLVGHMAIERNYEDKLFKWLEEQKEPLVTDGTIEFYDTITLDTFFQDEKYINLLNAMTGLDTRNDVNIFANGYKGQGFFDTVYNEKLKLPWWFWGISIGMIVLGFGISLIIIFTGRTAWKWLAILPWIIVGILGVLILISFFTNNTWAWINIALQILSKIEIFTLLGIIVISLAILLFLISLISGRLTKFTIIVLSLIAFSGLILILLPLLNVVDSSSLTVTDTDIETYHNLVLEASKRFLETGELPYDDNSGLSFIDSHGIEKTGALIEAETRFKFILLPLYAIIFTMINSFLLIKTYSNGKKRKEK